MVWLAYSCLCNKYFTHSWIPRLLQPSDQRDENKDGTNNGAFCKSGWDNKLFYHTLKNVFHKLKERARLCDRIMRTLHSSAFVVIPNHRDELAKKRTLHGKIVITHIIFQSLCGEVKSEFWPQKKPCGSSSPPSCDLGLPFCLVLFWKWGGGVEELVVTLWGRKQSSSGSCSL